MNSTMLYAVLEKPLEFKVEKINELMELASTALIKDVSISSISNDFLGSKTLRNLHLSKYNIKSLNCNLVNSSKAFLNLLNKRPKRKRNKCK